MTHGGRLQAARRRFPNAPEPFLDLSTGINPIAYPLPALPPEAFTRLPEPEAIAALERSAAQAYGVGDPAMVVAAPGTQILVGLIPRLWRLGRVAVIGPTYAEHAVAWSRAGAEVALVPDLPDPREGGMPDGVVLCNPNNPDGRRWPASTLLALADGLRPTGGLLLVDEAFCDFEAPEISLAPRLPHPAIVVLRSFGKTYGLAGVRLGFALAAPERAGAIRDALGPWAVSGPAVAIGLAAFGDPRWREDAGNRLARDGATLDSYLRDAGLQILGGTHLFRLAATRSAAGVAERLGRAGVLVRAFPDRPTWLRFGIPAGAPAWSRLTSARPALLEDGLSQR